MRACNRSILIKQCQKKNIKSFFYHLDYLSPSGKFGHLCQIVKTGKLKSTNASKNQQKLPASSASLRGSRLLISATSHRRVQLWGYVYLRYGMLGFLVFWRFTGLQCLIFWIRTIYYCHLELTWMRIPQRRWRWGELWGKPRRSVFDKNAIGPRTPGIDHHMMIIMVKW